jgi:Ran GTPase-activating protein (RanGAP) involved in mRNA processing and transport
MPHDQMADDRDAASTPQQHQQSDYKQLDDSQEFESSATDDLYPLRPYYSIFNPRFLSRDPILIRLLAYFLHPSVSHGTATDISSSALTTFPPEREAQTSCSQRTSSDQTPKTCLEAYSINNGSYMKGDSIFTPLSNTDANFDTDEKSEDGGLKNKGASIYSFRRIPSKPNRDFSYTHLEDRTLENRMAGTVLYHRNPSAPTRPMSSKPNRAFLYTQLIANIQTVTSILWPLALTGVTTMHDVIHYYRYPEDRYRYSLFPDTFFGFAPIEASWAYHFGADLMSDPHRYLLALYALWLPLPIVLTISVLRHCSKDANLAYLSEAKPGYHHALLPWNAYTHAIAKETFALLWDNRQFKEDNQNTLNALVKTAQQYSGLPYYNALLALANIANAPHVTKGLKDSALHHLTDAMNTARNPFTKLFATYQLWTLNRLPKSQYGYESLFWLGTAFSYLSILLANYHAIHLAYIKANGVYNYFEDKRRCEEEEKIFRCLNQIEACICALCADWAEASTTDRDTPSTHYAHSDDPQACLDALLSEKRTPEYLLATLPRFLGRTHTNPDVFDMSLQAGSTWTESEWDKLLSLLEAHQPALKTFNLSYPYAGGTPIAFSNNQLARLRLFLSRMQIEQLDLAGQNLRQSGLVQLTTGLSRLNWTMLDISRNQLGDESIAQLAALLPNLPALAALMLSENILTDEGAYLLRDALNQNARILDTLTHLDLSNNWAGETGLAALLTIFYNHSLVSLILSRLPLTPPVFAALSPLLAQLKRLSIVNSGVSNTELSALIPNNETANCDDTPPYTAYYDFSHNPFGDIGARYLLAAFPYRRNCSAEQNITQPSFANPAIALSLRYTQINDAFLPKITLFLAEKHVIGLKLDGTLITTAGMLSVLPDFCHPDAFLSELSLADISLADPVASRLADLLKTSKCREHLIALDLSHTALTRVGAANLLSALPDTQLQRLIVANNPLGRGGFPDVNQTQNATSLQVLDLSNTALSQEDTDRLLMLMTQSPNLTELTLNNNPLGLGAGIQLAQTILAPTLSQTKQLGNPTIPWDFRRLLGFQTPLAHPHLTPATHIKKLHLSNTNIGTSDGMALCRISHRAELNLNLENNPAIHPSFVNPSTCEISSAHTNTVFFPLLIFLWFIPYLFRSFSSTHTEKPTHARKSERADHMRFHAAPRENWGDENENKKEQTVITTSKTSSSNFFQPAERTSSLHTRDTYTPVATMARHHETTKSLSPS